MSQPIRVGILGHVGNQNLGDEAIIAAVIQNIRRHWPDAEIKGFTLNPVDTEARHGIHSFSINRGGGIRKTAKSAPELSTTSDFPTDSSLPQRLKELLKRIPLLFSVARRTWRVLETLPNIFKEARFLLDCRQNIRDLDLLIFAGSHQLNDFVGGPWNFPYTVFKWTLLARGAGAKVVFLSLGAGPIDTWLGRQFIRRALKRASYRSYRDQTAKRAVDTLYPNQSDKVVPDLAFSLDFPIASKTCVREGRPIVGINPLPYYTEYWHTNDETKYEMYAGKLAMFADWLVDQGYEVRFIPTQLKVDVAVIDDLRRRMTTNGGQGHDEYIFEPTIHCLDDLLSALANLDIMVATRYHGILLSLALHIPVLAIAYHSKSRDLMRWLRQDDYVVDGDDFTTAALIDQFRLLEQERQSISNGLRQQIPDFRSAIQAQYDEVFRLMEGTPDPRLYP